MVSARGSCYLSPEGQGLRTFPGAVATGSGGRMKPAHIGGGLGPATPLQAPRKGSKGVRQNERAELVWLVLAEGVRRLHAFLSQGFCSAESPGRKMEANYQIRNQFSFQSTDSEKKLDWDSERLRRRCCPASLTVTGPKEAE